jgi:S1-C subfamily serine protease
MLCAIGECLGQRNVIQVGYYQKSQKFSPNETETEISNITFNVIVHSAYINSGSSGGALVDKDLKLVGINFASASYESINKYVCTYAIPAEKAKEFINDYEGVS